MFSKLRNKKSQLADQELVLRFKKSGDQNFVVQLFQRYVDLIAAIALQYLPKDDAEDAVMEVYEILENDLRQHEIKTFNNWLYSVVKNHCLKKKRVKEKFLSTAFEDHHHKLLQDLDFTYDPVRDQLITSVGGAMSQLKDDQRKCLELFYWEEKSYKEIEQMTGLDVKKVKSHIQNGKRKLKKEIEV